MCISICYAFAGPGGTLKKIKALFSRNEEHCISKEVKGNALALKDKSCRPETTITAENACHDYNLPAIDNIGRNKQHFWMR